MSYHTIIFDLDGTLLNTLEDIHDSVNYALSKSGYPTVTLEKVRKSVGNGANKLIDNVIPAGTTPEASAACLEIYKEQYSSHSQIKTRPYDGVIELLKTLNENDFKLAVVSNKYDTSVKILCKDYFNDYIPVAIGDSANVAKKPAPDSVFHALSELESNKDQAVYVGDSDVDIQTAHNAGMLCISVTWGFRDRDFLSKEGADVIIDKPEELLHFLHI